MDVVSLRRAQNPFCYKLPPPPPPFNVRGCWEVAEPDPPWHLHRCSHEEGPCSVHDQGEQCPVSAGHDTVSGHWPAVRSGACVLHALSVQNYNKLLKSYNTDDQNRDVSVSCGWVWCGCGCLSHEWAWLVGCVLCAW